jgi:hypothetical protein
MSSRHVSAYVNPFVKHRFAVMGARNNTYLLQGRGSLFV